MAKFHKVKRYKKIYRSHGPQAPFKAILTIVGVMGLAVLGWGLYGPVSRFLNGEMTADDPVSASQSSQPISSSSDGQPNSSSQESEQPHQPSDSSQDESSTPEEEPSSPVSQTVTQGVYMPTAVLQNSAQRTAFLNQLEGKGMNTIFLDLKDTNGQLTYLSKVEVAVQSAAVMPTAVDLPAVVSELEGRGYKVAGRIHAFRDPISSGMNKEMAVQYTGTEWSWLDNARELGGKSWLNPFSTEAQGYINDLVNEAATAGVKTIVLDSVQFPVGFSLEKAAYGQTADNTSRQQVLKQFVASATTTGTAKGAKVSLYLPVTAILGSEVERFGGNPTYMVGESVMIGVMPSLFGNAYSAEELVLAAPVKSPYSTVSQALEKALPKLPANTERILLIQAHTATNVDPLHNMEYGATQVTEQVTAGSEKGCDSYLLYNPQGTYTLN